jgi:hypothetical protein
MELLQIKCPTCHSAVLQSHTTYATQHHGRRILYPYSDTCRTWASIAKVYGCVKHHFTLQLATGKPRFYAYKFGQHTKVTL